MSLKKVLSFVVLVVFLFGANVNFAQDGKNQKEVKKECSTEVKKKCASENSCCGDKSEPTVNNSKKEQVKKENKTEKK